MRICVRSMMYPFVDVCFQLGVSIHSVTSRQRILHKYTHPATNNIFHYTHTRLSTHFVRYIQTECGSCMLRLYASVKRQRLLHLYVFVFLMFVTNAANVKCCVCVYMSFFGRIFFIFLQLLNMDDMPKCSAAIVQMPK